jgi:tetratricopeptide (TPR) repeat protein
VSFYFKNRGLANYHLGNMKEAEDDYDMAIRLNPNNADNYFNRGNVWLSKEDPEFEKAHQDFDRAVQLEPDNAKLYHARGLAFQSEAEYISITGKEYDV